MAGPTTKFWTAVAEKFWLAFLISGLSLLVIGSTGKIPWLNLDVANVYFQIVLIVVGMVLVAGGLYFAKHQPPKPEPTKTNKQGKPAIDVASHEITVKAPKWGEARTSPVIISGSIKKKLPNGYRLWLINKGTQNGHPAYWPQDPADINDKGSWTLKYQPRNFKEGDERRKFFYRWRRWTASNRLLSPS